eukprot:CAMPEP_0171063966 /NCGR_PEP_ID=MMETSP0766_2-20121228/5995_1 /TAXON_ID=439317 /ORGANISM="Gambierdiscus australes, Strain CAWD 149" /LENGTH=290 /DNA_ID=CAMNT_0011519947 /DNA_START=647 /DNA_END=1519 /DNA_ORIENTATION=-
MPGVRFFNVNTKLLLQQLIQAPPKIPELTVKCLERLALPLILCGPLRRHPHHFVVPGVVLHLFAAWRHRLALLGFAKLASIPQDFGLDPQSLEQRLVRPSPEHADASLLELVNDELRISQALRVRQDNVNGAGSPGVPLTEVILADGSDGFALSPCGRTGFALSFCTADSLPLSLCGTDGLALSLCRSGGLALSTSVSEGLAQSVCAADALLLCGTNGLASLCRSGGLALSLCGNGGLELSPCGATADRDDWITPAVSGSGPFEPNGVELCFLQELLCCFQPFRWHSGPQ